MVSLDWKALWEEAQRGSFMEKGEPEGGKWQSFWDREAEQYLGRVKRDERFYRDIVGYLYREKAFRDGDTVLDIACGPGTYALQFAPGAKSVTALDLSEGMLATLAAEAGRRGLENIRPVKARWDEFREPGRFDLVFTALSPAMTGPEEFLRMEEFSARSCCYVTWGDEEQSRTRNDLWKVLLGEERGKKDFNVSYPFNLLMSLGRRPNVRFFGFESEERPTVDDLVDHNVKFFRNFVEMDAVKAGLIRDYFASRPEKAAGWSKKSLVALFWDVPER